jgi:hypothetical protein
MDNFFVLDENSGTCETVSDVGIACASIAHCESCFGISQCTRCSVGFALNYEMTRCIMKACPNGFY